MPRYCRHAFDAFAAMLYDAIFDGVAADAC